MIVNPLKFGGAEIFTFKALSVIIKSAIPPFPAPVEKRGFYIINHTKPEYISHGALSLTSMPLLSHVGG